MLPLAALLSGCVGFDVSQDDAGGRSVMQLCQTLTAARYSGASKESGAIAAKELAGRKVFSAQEFAAIQRGQAYPGMSETAGLCAWGGYWYDVNTTMTAGGTSKQYVFGDGQYVPRRYLYTENGRVTALQE